MRKTLLTAAICAAGAFGQTAAPGPKQVFVQSLDIGPVTMATTLVGSVGTVTGAPYSAQAVTERVQVLADGNRIQQTTSGSVARDSQGRVRRDEALPGFGPSGGDAPHIVTIDDPVAQLHWTLDAQTKTAMKMPIPAGRSGAFAAFGTAPQPVVTAGKAWFSSSGGGTPPPDVNITRAIRAGGQSPDSTVSETDLGPQTLEGVLAQGKRITRTIPAGQIGNEQPIVITTETWYSPDLKVLIMSKSDDPRMGETTYQLTNIQRSEPAADLFQAPADYTVKDMPGPPNVVYNEIKKD